MADQHQNQNGAKPAEPRKLRVEDTVWVICTSPITLLMPASAGKAKAQVPLKLERGVNVLAGLVPDGAGGTKYLTLDGLSAPLQQQPLEERGAAVLALFEEAKKLYAPMFQAVGGLPPRVAAVGTIKALATGEHLGALIAGANNGTHRASLEALTHHHDRDVPTHIKDLARARLTAWRPAA